MRAWRTRAPLNEEATVLERAPVAVQPHTPEVDVLKTSHVALVHDWLITFGGSERVLLALHRLFPEAPVFVALHDPHGLPESFHHMHVQTSWLQRVPGTADHHRLMLPLMPFAWHTIDLRGYKVVLSSSHACAKGVRVDPEAVHICYCHTPMRYVWELAPLYLGTLPPVVRPAAWAVQSWLRWWDRATVHRVTYFIANSRFVADRIWRHYRREATVIYPPVDVDYFTPGGRGDEFFLVVSRLVPYKRVDLAVAAFNQLGLPLVVVGDGPEGPRLRALARSNVTFVGEVSDETLREYYRRCRALVFPGEEDFGLVPVEAQACGRPVIAYGAGGARESVVAGETGMFFQEQTAPSLVAAVQVFESATFHTSTIRRQAERFSSQRFRRQMGRFVALASGRRRGRFRDS